MIKTFFDLNAWKEAHKLVLEVYDLLEIFPNKEEYALTSQVRRCSVSVTSNIAEGFARKSEREKINFYFIAKGSLAELRSQLYLAKDLSYISEGQFEEVNQNIIIVDKLISGLIKSAGNKPT